MVGSSNILEKLTFEFSASAISHGHIIYPDIVDWRTVTVARPATPITIIDTNRESRNPSWREITTSQATQNTRDNGTNVSFPKAPAISISGKNAHRLLNMAQAVVNIRQASPESTCPAANNVLGT